MLKLFIIVLLPLVPLISEVQDVFFDFGNEQEASEYHSVNSRRQYWNNVYYNSADNSIRNARNSYGKRTVISLRLTDYWTGFNSNGTVAGVYPPEVTKDSFYLDCRREKQATLVLSGLNDMESYTLELFSSRMQGVNDKPESRLALYLVNRTSRVLDITNNDKNTAVFRNIVPENGEIKITTSCAKQAKYAHLGALKISGNFKFLNDRPRENGAGLTRPALSSRAYGIADSNGRLLQKYSFRSNVKRQIASLTKLMTAFIVLQAAERNPEMLKQMIPVSVWKVPLAGSSAGVYEFDSMKLEDLLYATLVPSGSDAALVLANHFGQRILPGKKPGDCHYYFSDNPVTKDGLSGFVNLMNTCAAEMNLGSTYFSDPNGLGYMNSSSVEDLASMTSVMLRNRYFKTFTNVREYIYSNEGKQIVWENTNQLLDDANFTGIKTGSSNGGRYSLITTFQDKNRTWILINLGSSSNDSRFTDAVNLWSWFKNSAMSE